MSGTRSVITDRVGHRDRPLSSNFAHLDLVGGSPVFRGTLWLIERIAAVDATVLIQGETGTGKELAARALHYLSPRRSFPFVPVNCGALPDSLMESELFGHERGAFTDAKAARRGLVTEAEGGTLFFDEVEAMSARAQVVLLRFLQDREYRPVGGRSVSRGNLRIVASSNVNLEELVRRGQFRSDLLFRFAVLSVTMPPLRERGTDVFLLAQHFLTRFAALHHRPTQSLDPETIQWMTQYEWPGNVRELENLVLREVVLTDGEFLRISRPGTERPVVVTTEDSEFDQTFKSAKARVIAQFEKSYLSRLLRKTGGNISLAAKISRKDRSGLNKLVRKYGITCDRRQEPPEAEYFQKFAAGGAEKHRTLR